MSNKDLKSDGFLKDGNRALCLVAWPSICLVLAQPPKGFPIKCYQKHLPNFVLKNLHCLPTKV